MKTLHTSRTKRRGFTLTEIAIVLGIVGLILGAIWVAAAAVYNNLRVSHMNTAILQIAQNVRTLYGQQATITIGDITTNVINAQVVPSDLINGAALTNPWGGTMFVGGTTDGLGIGITVNGLPTSACISLISEVAGVTRDPTLTGSSKTANAALPAAPGVAVGTPLAVSVPPIVSAAGAFSAAGTGCTASSTTNAVLFVFGFKG